MLTQAELNAVKERAEKATAGETLEKLVAEIERLNSKLGECETLLSAAHDVMDDVHLYDTELYEEITQYFYGGDDE
jgi:hypothetical protein